MVAQFTGFGFGPQLVAKEPLISGMTLDGHQFTVSKCVYNQPPFQGAPSNETYSVDVNGQTSFGFNTEDEAVRFVHSTAEEEYTVHDQFGHEGKDKRTGLGVPEGMTVNQRKIDPGQQSQPPNNEPPSSQPTRTGDETTGTDQPAEKPAPTTPDTERPTPVPDPTTKREHPPKR